MIYAFAVFCLMNAAEPDCQYQVYELEKKYTDTAVCNKEMADVLKGTPEHLDVRVLDWKKSNGFYYNYGCVNWEGDPKDPDFQEYVMKMFGPTERQDG